MSIAEKFHDYVSFPQNCDIGHVIKVKDRLMQLLKALTEYLKPPENRYEKFQFNVYSFTNPCIEIHLHTSQFKQRTQHPSHPLHKHSSIFQDYKTLSSTTRTTQQIFPQTTIHSHYSRHIVVCLSILSTRGNNKILYTH